MSSVIYDTRNDLPEDVRSQVIDLLNRRLADAVDLETQTKQAHWNVKGPSFIALHQLFDEIHEAVDGYADLLAERVVQLGGVALGTARVAAAQSELTDYPLAPLDGTTHVTVLAGALAEFAARIRQASDEAGELGDQDASDICTEISRGVDKWLWFVEAHAQRPVGEASRK
jgi:starvation-inducible DNA-binding protein